MPKVATGASTTRLGSVAGVGTGLPRPPFQFRKMRNGERWQGTTSWYSERNRELGRDKDRERERERGREKRQRMLANWI